MNTSKRISFSKMQGAGNDFVVIDNRNSVLTLEQAINIAPSICNRKYGVGADGILLFEEPADPSLDYTMIYRNADGSNAGMCGNGARCLARFAHDLGLGSSFRFNVHDSVYKAQVLPGEQVELRFPLQVSIDELSTDVDRNIYQLYPGTEHIVIEVEEPLLNQEEKLRKRGRELREAAQFKPKGTNVNFICGTSIESIDLQTYERGVEDLTLACGTGAVASAIAWHHIQDSNQSQNTIGVHVKGGTLNVGFSYDPENDMYHEITLKGPAEMVFTGTYDV